MQFGGLRQKNIYKQSSNNAPLFSVVTVVYNGEKHIEQTIQSVLQQSYPNIEYIVVDGNSTDKTVDIIKKYENQIDYWVSEKDTGIYNAMNKGIKLCSGDYISFINADDWYKEEIFTKIVDKLSSEKPDYIVGNVVMLDENDKYLKTLAVDFNIYKRFMPFGHPGLFVKKDIVQNFKFNEEYKIVADYDFCIKLIEEKLSYKCLPYDIAYFRIGGVSNTLNTTNEIFQIHKRHFGFSHALYWYLVRRDNSMILALLKLLSLPLKILQYRQK